MSEQPDDLFCHAKKHLCKPSDGGCGNVWKPSDRYTVGVSELPEVLAKITSGGGGE